jgi:hypothetical protein
LKRLDVPPIYSKDLLKPIKQIQKSTTPTDDASEALKSYISTTHKHSFEFSSLVGDPKCCHLISNHLKKTVSDPKPNQIKSALAKTFQTLVKKG